MKSLLTTLTRLSLCLALTSGVAACGGSEEETPKETPDAGKDGEEDAGDEEEEEEEVDLSTCTKLEAGTKSVFSSFSEGCFVLESGNLDYSNGLRIGSGVTFYFGQDAQLIVSGGESVIEFSGTADEPVVLKNIPGATWSGVISYAYGYARFEHLQVSGVKSPSDTLSAVYLSNPTVTVTDSLFEKNEAPVCLTAAYSGASLTIENNTFKGCSRAAVRVSAEDVVDLSEDNDFGEAAIGLLGGTSRSVVKLPKLGRPYMAFGELNFSSGVQLDPGVELQMNSASYVKVLKSFTIAGTESEPIVFKSGPDARWYGLRFDGAGTSGQLNHVHIDGATVRNGDSEPAANLKVAQGASLTISNTRLTNSTGYAAYEGASGTLRFGSGNVYEGNAYNSVYEQ